MAQVHNTNHVFTYIQKLRCCSHPGHHKHSGRNPVTPKFLTWASTSHYDSTVLRQRTHDIQKLYGHESTMHPEKTCYTWKQRGVTFQLAHKCDRIFNFFLAALCLLASISDLFLHLHSSGIMKSVGKKWSWHKNL